MNISQKQLTNFKRIYQENFGVELTDQEALELTHKLLSLVKLVYKPIRKKDLN